MQRASPCCCPLTDGYGLSSLPVMLHTVWFVYCLPCISIARFKGDICRAGTIYTSLVCIFLIALFRTTEAHATHMLRKFRRLHDKLRAGRERYARRIRTLGKHPFVLPIVAFLLLAAVAGGIYGMLKIRGASLTPAATDIVIISYDHQTQTVPSHEPTVGALLAKLKIAVNPGDIVEPSQDTPINQDDFRINIYRAAPVRIFDGSHTVVGYSAATTPRGIAQQAGLTVYPEDSLASAPATNFLQQRTVGSVVTIERSVPVTLSVNGFPAQTRTLAKTVGQFLVEKHVDLGQSGHVTPEPATPITAGETIAVIRDGTGIQSVTQDIAMPVQYVDDATLAYGTFATRQTGSPGSQVLTYHVVVQHGQVVSQTLVQTVVTVQPVTEIIARGTSLSGIKGDMARAGISPDDYQYADYIISNESGWCPTKWQGQYGGCPVYHGTPTSPYVGYGLCQATPGYKMQTTGADWATNPVTQLEWCSGYALGRYGSWYNAYLYWTAHHNW